MSKSVALHTLGCKLNYSETSTLAGSFKKQGFTVKEFGENADIFVLNTCSVTDNADKECRQIIRSVLNSNPETYVIITGCYAQLQPQEIAAIHGVDLVLGSHEKFKVFEYADNFEKREVSCIHTTPVDEINDVDYAYSSDTDSRTRAFLKVQDGCDYNCSFCTIPLARGASRSLPLEQIKENASSLLEAGYNEIVLTGVNTGDYKYTFGANGSSVKYALINVLEELDKLSVPRVRISSIEPNLLSDEIIQLVKSSPRFCKHFHIPLQSGDADVLKRMRRRYNREHYENLVYKLNDEIPDIGIGVDVIVGFPGETDEMFYNTFEFLETLPISYLHVFSYSERRNTHAVTLPDSVSINKRKARSKMLRRLSEQKRFEFYKANIGKTHEVLFESQKKDGSIFGFSGNYIKTRVTNGSLLDNRIVYAKINAVESNLFAEAEVTDK